MRSVAWSLGLALLLAAPTVALGGRHDDPSVERTLRGSWDVAGRRVHIDMPPSSITIGTATDGRLTIEMDVRCRLWRRRCAQIAEDLELDARPQGDSFRLGVDGVPHGNTHGVSLRGRILVPRNVAVQVDLGVGELSVRDLEGPLDVDMGVGEAKLRLPQHALHSVHLGVGVGEAYVRVAGHEVRGRGWLGRSVDWDGGEGHSRVNVRVGVGEASILVD